MFLVPGDRDPRGNPQYCCGECAARTSRRKANRLRYLAVAELIRRHGEEYREIRAEISHS